MQNMRLPGTWYRMTNHAKLWYLVDTKQAKDLSEAGKVLSSFRKQKHEPIGISTARAMRLPYADT